MLVPNLGMPPPQQQQQQQQQQQLWQSQPHPHPHMGGHFGQGWQILPTMSSARFLNPRVLIQGLGILPRHWHVFLALVP
jgi:hypothetical protein